MNEKYTDSCCDYEKMKFFSFLEKGSSMKSTLNNADKKEKVAVAKALMKIATAAQKVADDAKKVADAAQKAADDAKKAADDAQNAVDNKSSSPSAYTDEKDLSRHRWDIRNYLHNFILADLGDLADEDYYKPNEAKILFCKNSGHIFRLHASVASVGDIIFTGKSSRDDERVFDGFYIKYGDKDTDVTQIVNPEDNFGARFGYVILGDYGPDGLIGIAKHIARKRNTKVNYHNATKLLHALFRQYFADMSFETAGPKNIDLHKMIANWSRNAGSILQ